MKRPLWCSIMICLLTTALAIGAASGQEKSGKAPAKSAAKPAETAPAATIGNKDTAKWTSTTSAAAATPEQKAALDAGKVMTVTGELVEVSCYLQLGKRGERHIPCGSDCLKNGQPFGVVTVKNQLYLILAEEHDPRRYAQADLREALIPLLAKQISVTGMHTMRNGSHVLYVQASELPGGKKEGNK